MEKETILEIREDGTYKLYVDEKLIMPHSKEGFKAIVENKKLFVKFVN